LVLGQGDVGVGGAACAAVAHLLSHGSGAVQGVVAVILHHQAGAGRGRDGEVAVVVVEVGRRVAHRIRHRGLAVIVVVGVEGDLAVGVGLAQHVAEGVVDGGDGRAGAAGRVGAHRQRRDGDAVGAVVGVARRVAVQVGVGDPVDGIVGA